MRGCEVRARALVGELKPPACEASVQQGRLRVTGRLFEDLRVIVDVAIGDDDVGPAITVEIGQSAAPADPGNAFHGKTEIGGYVEKCALAKILVHGVVL